MIERRLADYLDVDIVSQLQKDVRWIEFNNHINLHDFDKAHDALADIEATAKCFWKMRKLTLI